jgi:hypothetical protein
VTIEIEPLGSEVGWEGKIIRAGTERFRYDDGTEVARDKVWHPGAVGMLAVDDEHVWLTRQPREVIGDPASLEVPAGKLDVPGELFAFVTSPGVSDERVWLYLATDLSDAPGYEPDEDERIEILPWPLSRLDEAIEECHDSKSLIALLWLATQRQLAYGVA